MKRLVLLTMFLLLIVGTFSGCRTGHETLVTTEKVYNYVDTIRWHDSIVVVPVERYVDLVREYDTLRLSTSLASAEAWLDTTNACLRGSIWNKNTYTYEKEIIDHYIKKDSIVYRDRPVPYEVEKVVEKAPWTFKIYRFVFWVFVGCLVLFVLKLLYGNKLRLWIKSLNL